MANITSKTELNETPADGDILYLVDVSDTTDNANGSDKKVTRANLVGGLQVQPSEGAFANGDKTKLDGIAAGATANSSDATLLNVDNHTSGVTNKVYTATEQSKLSGIETGAQVNVQSDWNSIAGDSLILNKPTIPTLPSVASGAEVDTGTDDAKIATAKALKDSHNVPSVAPGTSGNVLTSNGTDWTSSAPVAGGGGDYNAKVGPGETYTTLAGALAVASSGWSILVTGATSESGTVTCALDNITVRGSSRGKASIDFNEASFTFSGNSITFDNFYFNTDKGGKLVFSGNGVNLTNLSCTTGTNSGLRNSIHMIYITGNYPKVSNFNYKRTSAFTDGSSSYAIIKFEYGDFPTLVNSTFDSGSAVYANGMVMTQQTRKSTISNCNFFCSAGSAQNLLKAESYTVVTNCIFENGGGGNAYAINTFGNGNVEVTNCIIKNTTRGVSLGANSTFTGNYVQCIDYGYCMYDVGSYSTINNNIFTTVSGGTYASAIRLSTNLNATVINNNVFSNIGVGVSGNYSGFILKNNVYDTVIKPISAAGLEVEIDNNYKSSDAYNKTMKYLKNTSGGTLSAGQAVILKSVAANDEVTTTTTAGDNKIWGIVASSSIANNAYGNITVYGTTNAKVDGTTDIAVGDFLSAFTTAGILQKATTGQTAIAIALASYTADDSNGTIVVRVISPRII